MMWEKCLLKSLYEFICRKENIMVSNQLDVTFQKTNKFANECIYHEKKTCPNSKENQLIYEYVYNLLFLEYVALNKKYWVENQSNFMLCYKELQDSKKEGHHHYPITTSCWFSEAD